jgi:transposase
MNLPMIVDVEDPKWVLLGNIFNIFDSRRFKQEMAKHGIKPAVKTGIMCKVIILALFFSNDISYMVSQLKSREDLRNFTGIMDVPFDYQIYEFYPDLRLNSS